MSSFRLRDRVHFECHARVDAFYGADADAESRPRTLQPPDAEQSFERDSLKQDRLLLWEGERRIVSCCELDFIG